MQQGGLNYVLTGVSFQLVTLPELNLPSISFLCVIISPGILLGVTSENG